MLGKKSPLTRADVFISALLSSAARGYTETPVSTMQGNITVILKWMSSGKSLENSTHRPDNISHKDQLSLFEMYKFLVFFSKP